MASRKVIGEAVGLMHRHHLNEDAAVEVLRHRASSSNVKLRDVAREKVDEANSVGGILWPVADC